MSDPIEKLTGLGNALEDSPMPLPASEIRARGDRIRRRRHALVAGASAAVVAAVAVPVIALTTGDSDEPPVAPEPTISDLQQRASTLSEANLLTSKDAIYPNGGADWRETGTTSGDGQTAFSPCAQSSLSGLGAASVFQRDFEFVSTGSGDVEPSLSFNQVIGEFDSDEAARSAYEEIQGWYDECAPAGSNSFSKDEWSAVPVRVDGEAQQMVAMYGPVDEELDPFGDEAWIMETGLLLTGDRISVLTQVIHGQDYNWPDGTPVTQMLPTAAILLAEGGGTTDTALDQDNLPTSDDAVFFSGSDWVAAATGVGEDLSPNPCLTTTLQELGALESWTRYFALEPPLAGGDNQLAATVSEFPSATGAEAAYADLEAQVGACADAFEDAVAATYEAGRTYPADLSGTGGEGQVLTSSYVSDPASNARDILDTGLAVVDNRLLVLTQHYVGQDTPPDDVRTTTLENAAPRLVETAGPGPATSAWPTEIPAGFPLISGWPDDDGSIEFQLDEPSEDNQAMIPAGELQACGNTAVERDAVDRLTARLQILESQYIREIQLFVDQQEAVTYVAHLRNLYGSCPTEDSGGAPPTFTTTVGDGAIGDESLDIRRASDGIGQLSVFVVRVGNAVTVSSVSGEGTGDQIDATATAHRENLADVVAAMNELQGGGSDPGGGGTAPSVLSDEHLIGPGDLPAVPDDAGWQQVPTKSTPTLVCQGAWLSTLVADEVATREFEVPAGGGADYPADMANIAVLQFADAPAASGAYETVLEWLRDCPASQTDYEPRIDTPVAPIEVATGPDVAPVDRAHQVRTTYGAPEVCPDGCDAAWFDHQAVAQTGDRLVLVTYAELAGPCPPSGGCDETEDSLRPWLNRVAAAVDATVAQASWDRP